MRETPSFEERYAAVPIPEQIVGYDADYDEQVARAKERFFCDVTNALDMGYLAVRVVCRVQRQDVVDELWYGDVQPLAGVAEEHDSEHGRAAHFTRYPLSAETVQSLREIHYLDDIIDRNRLVEWRALAVY